MMFNDIDRECLEHEPEVPLTWKFYVDSNRFLV